MLAEPPAGSTSMTFLGDFLRTRVGPSRFVASAGVRVSVRRRRSGTIANVAGVILISRVGRERSPDGWVRKSGAVCNRFTNSALLQTRFSEPGPPAQRRSRRPGMRKGTRRSAVCARATPTLSFSCRPRPCGRCSPPCHIADRPPGGRRGRRAWRNQGTEPGRRVR
jgi:hypothetical protein